MMSIFIDVAFDKAIAEAGWCHNAADERELHLASVSVRGQHQGDSFG